MLRDAERAVKQLRGDVKLRVQILNDCARQARQVDRTLADEREQARRAELRDEVRHRLCAELYGVKATPSDHVSDAADAVTAHVAGFRELKGIIDEQLRTEISEAVDGEPSTSPQNVLMWVRRQLPF